MTKYRKLVAALVGAVLVAVSQGLIQGTAAKMVAVVVAFLTAAGVHTVSNDTPPPPPPIARVRRAKRDDGLGLIEALVVVLLLAVLWLALHR